jgi:hypothetical protein
MDEKYHEFEVFESGNNRAVIRVIEDGIEIARYYATKASSAGRGGHSYIISGGKEEATITAISFEQAAMLYSIRH